MKEKYMKSAIEQAKIAELNGDVPIGCVIVKEGKVVGRGYNTRHKNKQAIGHAEINAIIDANNNLGHWMLDDCEMYVTLEPCQMCCGAIIQARIKKVFYGASDEKAGCVSSHINMLDYSNFNHKVEYEGRILEGESKELIKTFFKNLRKRGV